MKIWQIVYYIIGFLMTSLLLLHTVTHETLDKSEKSISIETAKQMKEKDKDFLEKFIAERTKNMKFPRKINEKMQVDNVYGKNNIVYFEISLMMQEKSITTEDRKKLREAMISTVCQGDKRSLISQIADYEEYIFYNQNKEKITTIKIKPTDCAQ